MIPLQTDVFAAAGAAEIFLVARVLFGVTLAFMGFNHFLNVEEMTGYAQFKGLPAPEFSVIASGVTLVAGGLGIALGAFPVLAAGALAVFLLVSAVTMHDFWSMDDPEEQQNEMTAFLKNVYGAAAALAFLVIGGVNWTYTVGVGLF